MNIWRRIDKRPIQVKQMGRIETRILNCPVQAQLRRKMS